MTGIWDLQEVRADLLPTIDGPLWSLLSKYKNIIFTYKKPDPEVYRQAVEAGAAYLDMDYSWPADILSEFNNLSDCKLVVSAHLFEYCPQKWPAIWADLQNCRGNILKMAVMVKDAADCAALAELTAQSSRPAVIIPMGPAGQLARILYKKCGSVWTYVCREAALATASGQLDLAAVSRYQIVGQPEAFFALLGGEQIAHSPGPAFYNSYFPYYPVVTERLAEVLPWLRRLGLLGASVTMPNKAAAFQICDNLSEAAVKCGAVNTIYWQDGRLCGDNSDYLAVKALLDEQCARPGRAVVLGAGGAARAVGAALADSGFSVTFCSRRAGRDLLGGYAPWEERGALEGQLLVNATPVGYRGENLDIAPRNFGQIWDLVMGEVDTPLINSARQAGVPACPGLTFWQAQARRQLEIFQGILRRR